MTSSAGKAYTPDPAKQEAFRREIENHRDIELDEMDSILSLADVIGVKQYQDDKSTEDIIANPVPEWLINTNPEGAAVLCNNTAKYEDELEDKIEFDPINSQLLERQRNSSNEAQATAIRARRTTIAFLIKHGTDEPVSEAS